MAIETDPGELIDKITLLEINAEAISDCEKLLQIRTELERKPLHGLAVVWHPERSNGVRKNIRPLKGRHRPQDTQREADQRYDMGPKRDKDEYAWFWSGEVFLADRVNDVRLTDVTKKTARDKAI